MRKNINLKFSKSQQRIMAGVLSIIIIVSMMLPSTYASAAANSVIVGDFTVSGDNLAAGTDYSYTNHLLTVLSGKEITISGTTTTDRISVSGGVSANIIFEDLNIAIAWDNEVAAFDLQNTAQVVLTLKGSNHLTSGDYHAALYVPVGTSLTVEGEGSLETNGGFEAAGIGGNKQKGAGTIVINGGTITAKGNDYGAGIGSGDYSGNIGNITINGGTVYASANVGNGIGAGAIAPTPLSGSITVSGGSVFASSQNAQAMGVTPTDGKGNNVYQTTVAFENVKAVASVPTITGVGSYGLNDIKTDASGKIYLWLPVDTEVTYAVADSLEYKGSVKTTNDSAAAGTLSAVAYDISVTGGIRGTDYTYLSNTLTILTSTAMTLSGTTTTDHIVVGNGVDALTANLTLDNMSVQANTIAFTVSKNVNLNLTLVNENSSQTNNVHYGSNFLVESGSTVTFTAESTGTLNIPYVYHGGGIKADGSTVNICGGTVITTCATNTNHALSADKLNISGGQFISISSSTYGQSVVANSVKISGGTVTIVNGKSYPLTSNSIEITGGSVSLNRWENMPIMSSTPTDGNGNPVYLTTLTMNDTSGILANTAFTSMEVKNLAYTYGMTNAITDDNGKLYVYLPENKTITSVTDGQNITYLGKVALQADNTVTGSFSPAAAPVITTQVLTNATNIIDYSLQLEATGNPSDFVWEITSGALPEGMMLSQDGILSGKPVGSGDFVFTVSVSNEFNETATKQFTLTVDPSYIVTIPAEATLGTTKNEVKAENVKLPEGKQLEVALTATSGVNNAFTLSTADGVSVFYTVKCNGNMLEVGDKVLTVDPKTSSIGSALITFTEPTNKQFAGTYTGTVTFTVSVADAN